MVADPEPNAAASSEAGLNPNEPDRVNFWLAKTESETFGWEHLIEKGVACWDGVRNVEARNNLRAMRSGDQVFIYHTGLTREIVGIANVVREAYRDPTSKQAIWSAVDVTAKAALVRPVTLASLKLDAAFSTSPLVTRPRLSVVPLTAAQAARVLELAHGTTPNVRAQGSLPGT